jgi:hypothetical protein
MNRMNRNFPYYINRWTILGALLFAAILIILALILIGWTSPRINPEVGFVPAYLTMLPAPTQTPNITATFTPDPSLAGASTLPPDTIGIGVYVQISGTEGEGLNIRSTAGINADSLFLGYDEEVFLVKDGPKEADGYTWWYLVAPYDDTRAGWAASNFLTVVPNP